MLAARDLMTQPAGCKKPAQTFDEKLKRPTERTVKTRCCCCYSAYLSSCHRTASDPNYLIGHFVYFYCNGYFVFGGIHTCIGVSSDPMFQWISLWKERSRGGQSATSGTSAIAKVALRTNVLKIEFRQRGGFAIPC